jgi:D-alanyl-D-alanine carboxypeptidase/D-alanyl-D-alanine-endopeptidase (penicillin-binding protein 4)
LSWLVADPHPASYNARLLAGLWRDMGGVLGGRVRAGPPPAAEPSFHHVSPALAEVVRDINKYSNNVMAQQLFLTLAAEAAEGFAAAVPAGGTTTAATVDGRSAAPPISVSDEDARRHLQHRLQQRLGEDALAAGTLVVDNGSGLSRDARISARLLARLLTQVYDSPVMPEFMASLPIGGVDGTLRRSRATPGRAHLKTGSLRDVTGLAGYALSHSGRRYVLVALVNHANAGAARTALDALVQWTLHDLPLR